MENNKITSIQSFIEEYYPDYDHSDEIAHESDLYKLMNDEYEQSDCADELLQSEYGGDIRNPRIEIDHATALIDIYEESIKGYIEQQKQKNGQYE